MTKIVFYAYRFRISNLISSPDFFGSCKFNNLIGEPFVKDTFSIFASVLFLENSNKFSAKKMPFDEISTFKSVNKKKESIDPLNDKKNM